MSGDSSTGGHYAGTATSQSGGVVGHYFDTFHPARKDKWVFGDRVSGTYLIKFSWTRIVRHQMVKGGASPYDPALAEYWNQRRTKNQLPMGRSTLRLLQAQQGRCPLCGDYLLHADHQPRSPIEWERWLAATRKAITKHAIATAEGDTLDHQVRLIHAHCQPDRTRPDGQSPSSLQYASLPSRLA
ncbi:hypothetical protein GCM10022224_055130 [Nonomuraea antimicrobica]|uniref:HNH endonuclease n=1 Tax=Nonomuraea antimicrobica TaxID=561173 RepID=A0ABP7CBY2_9ACTN